ncbi:putative harbinger transposase-derived protein [Helianthus annuus]|nr:putative harbinger transposase-derived protein [Helianthus annuus]
MLNVKAAASQDLWFWHAFFGAACSNNPNILDQSPLFNKVVHGFHTNYKVSIEVRTAVKSFSITKTINT